MVYNVFSGNVNGLPTISLEIIDFIAEYMERHGFRTVDELSGALEG